MKRRVLGEMLTEVAAGVLAASDAFPIVRPQRIEVTLPVEVWLAGSAGAPTLLAELPRWRWRTAFDQAPSQLRVVWDVREA